jgi:hypothetical protein
MVKNLAVNLHSLYQGLQTGGSYQILWHVQLPFIMNIRVRLQRPEGFPGMCRFHCPALTVAGVGIEHKADY